MGPTAATTEATFFVGWKPRWMVSLLIVIVALFFGYPQPDLRLDEVILPLARTYAKKEHLSTVNNRSPLRGVNVVITGATSGIGLGLTEHFTAMGATVIGMGRSIQKLRALQERLAVHSNNGPMIPVHVQLGDLESVQHASEEIISRFDSIDILVNNAGIHYAGLSHRYRSNEGPPSNPLGIDLSLSVNYLSHFLLTEKLLPLLGNSTYHPTVIHVSSTFHFAVDGSDLMVDSSNDEQQQPTAAIPGAFRGIFAEQRAYANSKLAQILHARALQRRHPKLRFKSICPCWVGTSIVGESFMGSLLRRFAFPYNGYGIRSALQAALDATTKPQHADQDWFTNSHFTQLGHAILPKLFFDPWVYRSTPLRDLIVQSFAFSLLPLQKFGATIEPRRSSPESYNETLQESLYEWSHRTVRSYL